MNGLMHAVVLLVFSSVAVSAADGPPLDAGTMCPSIYQPVCASKGDERRTFANACLARGAGFTVIAQGGCGGGGGLPRFEPI